MVVASVVQVPAFARTLAEMQCSSCGSPIPAGARFCPSCGTAVGSSQPEERRIVTVLFADLVGFTALSEYLDPEQVKRIVDSCFESLVDVVVEFGGRVDKVLGDGMLVLFGAPVAHEDDPERAVRAALRMQETLADRTATSNVQGLEGLRMRIGINTGEVLVGTLAGSDYTAMGDVVNTASRLQTSAPPGGVLVGAATHALTTHSVEYEAAGELQARGREQPVTAWLAVQATAPPGTRRRRRRDVPMVGRDIELEVTLSALQLVARHERGLLLHVVGENGVGKSRLVDEVLATLRHDPEIGVLEGACVPYGEANVWFPFATALSSFLDLEPGLPLEMIRAGALEKSRHIFGDEHPDEQERLVDVFTHLLGYPSPLDRLDAGVARNTIQHALVTIFEKRSHRGPIVLSIDDLHWADPLLIDLLAHLVNSLARHPFVLVTAMRPGHDVSWPPPSERMSVISLTLQPLDRDETEELARTLLDDEPDDTLLHALYDRSGGNPLFLLELAALTDAGGGQRELPDSLRSLIAARLDQLTIEQRQVLENAAVLGTSGNLLGLENFARELGQPFSLDLVLELDDIGLLEVHGRRWEFRSDSVRDAAYQTLTKAARAQRHAGVSRSLRDAPARIDDRAHHAASAAELVQELGRVDGVPPDIAATAVELLTAAADRALDAGSLRLAVRHSTRAIDLADVAGTDDLAVAHLRIVRATAEIDQRSFEAATADIDVVEQIAERLDDVCLEAEGHRLRGMLANVAGKIDTARTELGLAVDLLRRAERPALLADALRARGFIEMFGGSLVDAEWFFGEADELYRDLEDARGMAYIEQHRAWIAFLSSDLVTARERLGHAATTLASLGDRNGVGWANGLLAFIEFFERHFDEAEALAVNVRREAEQRGDEWAVGMMDTLVADLRLWQGQLEDALVHADRARARFRRLNDRFGLIQSLAPLVRSQVALGRNAAAQRSAEELLALAETGQHGPFPLLAVAGAAMHRGNGAIAGMAAERAIDVLREAGANTAEPLVVLAVARAQQGKVEEALALIESVPAHAADHPFTHAATALVLACAHQAEEALEHSDAVWRTPGATYLDEVMAYVAAAGAAEQTGDHRRAVLSAEAAVVRALAVGDVVASALATSAYAAVTGQPHPAHDAHTSLGDGWATVLAQLTPAGVAG